MLGLTVAQTTDADSYTVQNEDLFFLITSQGYAVGSIVCWTDGGYGHVGYVTEVGQDGQIQILESNYNNQQQINNYRGWFDPQNSTTPGSVSYIYPGA